MKLAAFMVLLAAPLAGADSDPTPPPKAKTLAAATAACKRGDAKACTRAGDLHVASFFSRNSRKNDGELALAMYRRGCVLEDVNGCTGVAWVLLEGMTAASDPNAALKILEVSCEAKDMAACTLIAGELMPSNGTARKAGIAADFSRAFKLYTEACDAGTPGDGCLSGCNTLASMHYYGTHGESDPKIKSDHAVAAKLYERACTLGCINSCDKLGDMLREGDGIERDAKRAATFYQKACDVPFSVSCNSLGELYAAGDGVPKNPAKAKQLRDRACKLSRNQISGCNDR